VLFDDWFSIIRPEQLLDVRGDDHGFDHVEGHGWPVAASGEERVNGPGVGSRVFPLRMLAVKNWTKRRDARAGVGDQRRHWPAAWS
jgi:hypothetical protein